MKLYVRIRKKLRDFDLDVEFTARDGVFALLGASGCGKSMTLKIIAGIETPDEGQVIFNGRTLFDSDKKINLPPQTRRVGYLFQNYALFPNMTVAENILFAMSGTDDEKNLKLKENLSRLKLDGLENSYPRELSGGQQQRVALSRILTSHAEFLLLDEPFSALDSFLKWQLELELLDVFKSYGNAAILVSHDRNEVFRLADRVAVLNAGKVDVLGTVHEIFSRPQTVAAAVLTGCKNISAARKISEDKLFAEDWQLTLTAKKIPDDLKFIGIHDHNLELRATAGENTFPFEIVRLVEDSSHFLLMVRVPNSDALPIRWQVNKKFRRADSELFLHIPAEKIILLNR